MELGSHKGAGQSFAGPGEIKRREVELDHQESPRRDQEQGGRAGPSREPQERSRAGR